MLPVTANIEGHQAQRDPEWGKAGCILCPLIQIPVSW